MLGKVSKFIVNSKSPLKLKDANGVDKLVDSTTDVRFSEAREAGDDRARLVSIAFTHEERQE